MAGVAVVVIVVDTRSTKAQQRRPDERVDDRVIGSGVGEQGPRFAAAGEHPAIERRLVAAHLR